MSDASTTPEARLIVHDKVVFSKYADMVLFELGDRAFPLFRNDLNQIINFLRNQLEALEQARWEEERKQNQLTEVKEGKE